MAALCVSFDPKLCNWKNNWIVDQGVGYDWRDMLFCSLYTLWATTQQKNSVNRFAGWVPKVAGLLEVWALSKVSTWGKIIHAVSILWSDSSSHANSRHRNVGVRIKKIDFNHQSTFPDWVSLGTRLVSLGVTWKATWWSKLLGYKLRWATIHYKGFWW